MRQSVHGGADDVMKEHLQQCTYASWQDDNSGVQEILAGMMRVAPL